MGILRLSTIAVTIYTIALAIVWYRRTGWEHAKPVAITAARAAPVAAIGAGAAWYVAQAILDSGTGFWIDGAAVAAGGLLVLVVVFGPRWVRRDLMAA